MVDLIIKNGYLVTMDPKRATYEDGAVAVEADRIVAIGDTQTVAAQYPAANVIDARGKAILPGLIDSHAHAGHTLLKTIGTDLGDSWNDACYEIYQKGSDPEFWYADAQLSALERIKCGTTTSINHLGGGNEVMRTDLPVYGEQHCEAIQQSGIREFLAAGPSKPPFPKTYTQWRNSSHNDLIITFENQMKTSEELIQRWHGKAGGRISVSLTFPIPKPNAADYSISELQELKWMAAQIGQLRKKYDAHLFMDGHSRGTVKFTHEELDLLGPHAHLSHSTNLTAEEIALCAKTDTRIVHNPSAIFSIFGRCPVPELLDAGVTVTLGSDGAAPDRSYDMFRHMTQCMHYQRTYYHDPSVLPPGKVLEMVTIDAARGLGMDHLVGSLEPGKKADIILIDMQKPHIYPIHMPLYRIVYYALGSDVDTTIVDGKILMEKRIVKTIDEKRALEMAQTAADTALDRTGLRDLLRLPDNFWGASRF